MAGHRGVPTLRKADPFSLTQWRIEHFGKFKPRRAALSPQASLWLDSRASGQEPMVKGGEVLLLRPNEVSTRTAHASVLEVADDAFGRALQHVRVLVRRLAQFGLGAQRNALVHFLFQIGVQPRFRPRSAPASPADLNSSRTDQGGFADVMSMNRPFKQAPSKSGSKSVSVWRNPHDRARNIGHPRLLMWRPGSRPTIQRPLACFFGAPRRRKGGCAARGHGSIQAVSCLLGSHGNCPLTAVLVRTL
jgi:hypothetical protein